MNRVEEFVVAKAIVHGVLALSTSALVMAALQPAVLGSLLYWATMVALTGGYFAVGLLIGKKLDWRAQPRADREVAWGEAIRTFWPQTLFGLSLTGLIAATVPGALPWAAPVLAGLSLSVPFAVLTASAGFERALTALGLCAIPEDRRPTAPIRGLLGDASAPEPAAA